MQVTHWGICMHVLALVLSFWFILDKHTENDANTSSCAYARVRVCGHACFMLVCDWVCVLLIPFPQFHNSITAKDATQSALTNNDCHSWARVRLCQNLGVCTDQQWCIHPSKLLCFDQTETLTPWQLEKTYKDVHRAGSKTRIDPKPKTWITT